MSITETDIDCFDACFESYLLNPDDPQVTADLVARLRRDSQLRARYADSLRMQVHLRSVLQVDAGLVRPSARHNQVSFWPGRSSRPRRRSTLFISLAVAVLLLGIIIGMSISQQGDQQQSVLGHASTQFVDSTGPSTVSFTVQSGSKYLSVNDDLPATGQATITVSAGTLISSTGAARLLLSDGSRIALMPDTRIHMHDPRSGSGIKLKRGTLVVSVESDAQPVWRGTTQDGLIYQVTGTSFLADHRHGITEIRTRTGSVEVVDEGLDEPVTLTAGMAVRKDHNGYVETGYWRLPAEVFASWTADELRAVSSFGSEDAILNTLPDGAGWRFSLPIDHPLRQQGMSLLIYHPQEQGDMTASVSHQEIFSIRSDGGPRITVMPSRDDQGQLNKIGTNFIYDPNRGSLDHYLTPREGRAADLVQQIWEKSERIDFEILSTYGTPERVIIFTGAHSQYSLLLGLAFAEIDEE